MWPASLASGDRGFGWCDVSAISVAWYPCVSSETRRRLSSSTNKLVELKTLIHIQYFTAILPEQCINHQLYICDAVENYTDLREARLFAGWVFSILGASPANAPLLQYPVPLRSASRLWLEDSYLPSSWRTFKLSKKKRGKRAK